METRVEQSYEAHGRSIDRYGRYSGIETQYLVFGALDEDAALRAVLAEAPEEHERLPLESIEIDARENETTFRVNAVYKRGGSSAPESENGDGEPTVSFDCSAGSMKLNVAVSQRRIFGDKDPGNLVGWNGKTGAEMEIAGVEIPIGTMRESYEKTMPLSKLTTAYKRRVNSLVGKVNDSGFRGWARGEVMFMGAQYSAPARGAVSARVVFNFAIRENEENASISGIPCGRVNGHDYLWVIPGAKRDSGNGIAVELEGGYVAQVAKYRDFGILGV